MSDARSARSGRTCYTRSEAAASTTSSVRSEARRRAALSKLRAEQGQRAAAAKAELARQQAEQAAEQARQQAELARQQAELARQQAELEAQELKDEADAISWSWRFSRRRRTPSSQQTMPRHRSDSPR